MIYIMINILLKKLKFFIYILFLNAISELAKNSLLIYFAYYLMLPLYYHTYHNVIVQLIV